MKKTLILLILNLIAVVCKSQEPVAECLFVNDTSVFRQDSYDELFESKNGYLLSPNGVIRVLVVFAEIEYDIHPDKDPNPDDTDNWPVGEYPLWRNQLFDHEIHSGPLQGLVTKYFYEASFGNYYVLGDYLINSENSNKIFKIKESDGYNYLYSNASAVLCNKINQNANQSLITHYGYNDIDYFDNWTYTDKGKEKISPSIDNPRRFDYVVFIWRNCIRNNKALNNTGFSTPSLSDMVLLGYGTDFCMNIGTFSHCPTNIIRHEYAHGLLGGNSFHTAGGGDQEDYWIPLPGGWSALGLSGSSLQCCSGWDRQRLGWCPLGSSFELSAHDETNTNRVNGDLDALDETNEGIYWLRDFITSGDAIRIKLPFIETSTEYPEYLWIENHTGNSDFDKWQYEGLDCIDSFPGGLMTYVQIDKDIRSDYVKANVFGGYAGYLRPLTANGFYDRSFENQRVFNDCVQWDSTNAFSRCMANPLTGGGDEEHYVVDFNGDNVIKYNDERSNFVERNENGVYDYKLFMMGHNSHVFNLEGVTKIGVSTNPSTASMMNMVGHDSPNPDAKNVRKVCLNGISIEILDRDLEHSLKIRIRFDDIDINNDVRWCADSIILNNIPTISGYSLNVKQGKTILLDQGLTATRMKTPIDYQGQKIFASPTTFIVQPDVKIHLDTAASIVLENSSKLCFRERSSCVIEDRSTLIVKRGTVLQLDDCASLVINGTGKLIVEEGAELRISPMAILAFQNGLQNLEMESGVIIYHIFANPNTLIANTISNAVITSSTTWSGLDCKVNGSIVVENGATLSIESSLLRFNDLDGCIVVKQGGKLIIDSSMLKSERNCSDMWQGIEVWGNSYATQSEDASGQYAQGYVELRKGATIENAVCALALWRPDHWSTTGGIVHAEDAVFRNNQRSVHALHYKNTSPINGKQTDYNSWFKRCQFIVDENYLGDEDHVFHKHVDLDHVRGIKFFACNFSVAAPSSNISYWTSGIAGNEAGFTVAGLCSNNNIYPCPSYDNSTFSGFLSAISAVNDGTRTPPTITVTHSSFNNNDFGIYVSNLSNTSVRFCDFNVKRHDNWLCGAGIFLENVLNYSVEENALAKTNTFNGDGYGVVIKNCAVQSKVYRNQFENLYCGNLAWGRNILMKSSNNYIGLEYGCNTNTGNTFDFYVLGDEGVFSGLQSSQGSSLAAARNTFSTNGYHFYNSGDHRITYYYYNVAGFEDEKPLSYNVDKVQIDSTNLTDDCPSNFGNGVDPVSLVLTPAEKYQREQDYYEAYTAYNGLKAVYDSRIDGGNTNNMLYDIASATPSDMWALRTQLLGASPYLSREVLTDASDRDDVFTESVLFEILLSNPDELKKDSLMYHLRNKTNPLPQYMMNILDQVANGTTARTVMQNRMAAYRGEYTRAAGDIIRSLVNDTVLDITELRGWLANMKDFYADRDIIATYVDEGDFTNALTLANMLPSLYGLTGNDLVEHNDYVELLELYRDLYNDDRNIMQLDSTERAQVERIAVQSSGYPQAMAQAILYGTNWESYAENPFDCPTLTLPQGGQRGGYAFTQEDLGRALGLNVSVKPNPATTWAAVDYSLPAKLSKATITVSNALGVTVMSTELNGNQGQKVLDLRGLADGVYLYTIRSGEYVQTGKLVIAK